MNKNVTAIVCAVAMAAAPGVWAQGSVADVTDMKALRAAVQTDKRAFVASTLQLSEAEAKKFWPLYDAYQRKVDLANRERTVALEGVIGATKPVSDLYAKNLAKQLVAADEIEVKARRTLYNRLMRALPAKKAAQYLQLEAKIRAEQAYQIAVTFPLLN
jgi:Spy/CpxP family protein refolding chaperone